MNHSTQHSPPCLTTRTILVDEDEAAVDVDEPPEHQLRFDRKSLLSPNPTSPIDAYLKIPTSPLPTKNSLLTQALHTTSQPSSTATSPMFPALRAPSTASVYSTTSLTSTAELTSDGDVTSPARSSSPSPPLPPSVHPGLLALTPKNLLSLKQEPHVAYPEPSKGTQKQTSNQCLNIEAQALAPRKRCIMFAGDVAKDNTQIVKKQPVQAETPKVEAAKRPYMLKFICPSKPQKDKESLFTTNQKSTAHGKAGIPVKATSPLTPPMDQARPEVAHGTGAKSLLPEAAVSIKGKKYQPEGMRFHEFAGDFDQEEEWVRACPTTRQKLTINDTLRKELAIRKLGEEAEEEADEEDKADEEEEGGDEDSETGEVSEELDDEDEDEKGEGDNQDDEEKEDSDGGNESDDEEGFAASDNESELGSEYHFWTPGVTTAATSTDQLDHIRSRSQRRVSVSSIDSNVGPDTLPFSMRRYSRRRNSSSKRSLKFRPGTPELPDSTDFVCGTLDEDRPMEAAYISCLEQRRRSKQPFIPQDVDPSFPSSDLDEEDDDAEEMNMNSYGGTTDDEHLMFTGHIEETAKARGRRSSVAKPPHHRLHSPPPTKRHRSPPPTKHRQAHRSPPPPKHRHHSPPLTISRGTRSPPPTAMAPRPLFNSPTRFHSSPPHLPRSPPSSRHPSPSHHPAVPIPHLAQRPTLTHTKSLPRTPNPFYTNAQHHKHSHHALHSKHTNTRGAIAIVQGLDMKRARRREKYYRQQQLCREKAWREHKGKGDRCAPGIGVQRMRTLGLEVQERCRGYGIKLGGAAVLSI